MQHMGAKGMKALFFNGFHIYIYMWQKGGKRGQKPPYPFGSSFLLQFCFPAFYAADHKKAPPLQGRADFCTHLYAVWVHWFMRVFAHFSRDALKCTHP